MGTIPISLLNKWEFILVMVGLLLTIGIVLISIFALVKSADYLIDGAADIARFLKVSPLLIGLTIVAFGTSLPEFIVSLFSVLSGSSDISIGAIIGSNIANIGLGIGICAILATLTIKSKTLIYELPFLLVSNFLVLIFANDRYIFNKDLFLLGRFDGILFLIIFVIFMYYIFKSLKEKQKNVVEEFKEDFKHENSVLKNVMFIVGGLVGILISGKFFIDFASDLAILAGLSEGFIGLTIAAIGTSLPELVTSIKAALKGHGDLAIGNIVGSNIFNILFVLGITSIIKPIAITPSIILMDGMILLFLSLLFLLFATSQKKIEKSEGAILVLIYAVYLGFKIINL